MAEEEVILGGRNPFQKQFQCVREGPAWFCCSAAPRLVFPELSPCTCHPTLNPGSSGQVTAGVRARRAGAGRTQQASLHALAQSPAD